MSERPKAPMLRYNYPGCGLCGEETTHDGDSLVCEDCGIGWPDEGGRGVFLNEDKPHCGDVFQPFTWSKYENIRDHVYECLLDEGHGGGHRGVRAEYPEYTWAWWPIESTAGETRDVTTPGGAG